MAKGGARTATGSFDYDILQSLQAIQGDVKAIFSVFKKDSTKQYEESRKALSKKVPKDKKDKFKLPKLPDFKSMFDKLGDGVLDFGKIFLAGAFLAGLLKDKIIELFGGWDLGGIFKDLFTYTEGEMDMKTRISDAIKAAGIGGLIGGGIGWLIGGPVGMLAGALMGAAIGGLVSMLMSDKGPQITKMKEAIRSKINMNAQKAGLAAGGIAGFLIGGPIGMVAGAILGLALGTLIQALSSDTTFNKDAAMAELKKGAMFVGVGAGIGGLIGTAFGLTIPGMIAGAILGLAIFAINEAVVGSKLKTDKTQSIAAAIMIVVKNIFLALEDMLIASLNWLIKKVNLFLPEKFEIDEMKADTKEMNKAQRDQVVPRAKILELGLVDDRAMLQYEKLDDTSKKNVRRVKDITGFDLYNEISKSDASKMVGDSIETRSTKLPRMWNAHLKLANDILAESKAEFKRDNPKANIDSLESQEKIYDMASEKEVIVRGREIPFNVAERPNAFDTPEEIEQKNAYAKKMKEIRLANKEKKRVEAEEISLDKKIYNKQDVNMNRLAMEATRKNIQIISDEIRAGDRMKNLGQGTVVVTDNSTMNNSTGSPGAPVFENYAHFTSASRKAAFTIREITQPGGNQM